VACTAGWLITGALLLTAACGDDDGAGSGGGGSAAPPAVVATLGLWADVVDRVACDGLEVTTLVPAGADPHGFEPSLADRARLGEAALVVANGLMLEESLADTIEAAEDDGTPVFRIGEHVDTIGAAPGEDGHEHDGADPHFWFDPTRVSAALPALGEALATATGLDEAAIEGCVARYQDELAAADAEVAAILGEVPEPQRKLVTTHASLTYLADRYGFEVIGTVIPGTSTLAEAGPASLEALARAVEAAGVGAVFVEEGQAVDDVRALAERVGDVEVVTLATDTLGEPGTATDSYIGLLVTAARLIANGLT